MEIFQNDDYLHICNFIETKLPELRKIERFNKIYLENSNLIEVLDSMLKGEEKDKFDKLIKSFYELEEYYFAFAYLLGVKFNKNLENL